jgi:signal transduction histidine kinase
MASGARPAASRRESALLTVVAALVASLVLGLVRVPDHLFTDAMQFDAVVLAPATMAASIGYYVGWRLQPTPTLGWFSAAMIVLGMQATVVTAFQIMGLRPDLTHPVTSMAWDLVITLLVVGCWLTANNRDLRWDPAAAGMVAGAALAGLRLLSLCVPAHLADADPGIRAGLAAMIVAVDATVIVLAAFGGMAHSWLQHRIALALVAFSAGHLARSLGDGETAAFIAVVGVGLCAAIVATTAWGVAARALRSEQERVEWLSGLVTRFEGDARSDRARMHELNATLAGVSSAAHLVHAVPITDLKRAALGEMIDAELSRLQRLVSDRLPAPSERPLVDLGAVISHLVIAHEARGHHVDWDRCAAEVAGDADQVTEVLNILLDNAAAHGGGGTCVRVSRRGEGVEVGVSDAGSGVPLELRDRIFSWGARGPDSTGQGIGLRIARDLAQMQPDGRLDLRDDHLGRTEFVFSLRAPDRESEGPCDGRESVRAAG